MPGTYAITATMLQALYYVDLDYAPTTPAWTPARQTEWQALLPLYTDFLTLRSGQMPPHAFIRKHAELMRSFGKLPASRKRLDRRATIELGRPLVARFGTLTFIRLVARLRDRTPTAVLGHCIFIYDLDADDLREIFSFQPASAHRNSSRPG